MVSPGGDERQSDQMILYVPLVGLMTGLQAYKYSRGEYSSQARSCMRIIVITVLYVPSSTINIDEKSGMFRERE